MRHLGDCLCGILDCLMDESFPRWLNQQIQDHGWTQAEFARRANISTSHVSRVIAGTHEAGLEFFQGTSRTFRMPMEDVLRLAGILPPRAPAVRERRRIVYEVDGEERVLALWRALSVEDQARVRDLMERLAVLDEPKIIGA